jgi:hypothetical protein
MKPDILISFLFPDHQERPATEKRSDTVRTAVVQQFRDIDFKMRFGRDIKGAAGADFSPVVRSLDQDPGPAAQDLHQLRGRRVEPVAPRHHHAQGFFRTVRKEQRSAGYLSIFVNIGFRQNRNIFEFHARILTDSPKNRNRVW